MNFSSHTKQILENLEGSFKGGKLEILSQLKDCLLRSRDLLKSNQFDYWIKQFELVEMAEIATTEFGVAECQSSFKFYGNLIKSTPRNHLSSVLLSASENLMTCTLLDELCFAQSQYHWYYSILEETPFQMSELGFLDRTIHAMPIEIRIAKIFEVEIEVNLTNLGLLQ